DKVKVKPGFRVIHDLTLGREVIARGPKNALAHLSFNNKQGRFSPDFDRPVKLKELVEVRINLEAHGSKILNVSLDQALPERTLLQPDFTTEGPLSFRILKFWDIPQHPIQIESENVVVDYDPSEDHPEYLQGSANKLEFIYYISRNNDTIPPQITAPNLQVGETIHTIARY
ncbi:MAG: hypothetical protein AAGA31_15060, partial [Bacteroidota bacterium]